VIRAGKPVKPLADATISRIRDFANNQSAIG
jgi:hypothetical protein